MKKFNSSSELMAFWESKKVTKEIFLLITTLMKFPALKTQPSKIDAGILNSAVAAGFVEIKNGKVLFTELSSKFVQDVVTFGRSQGRL